MLAIAIFIAGANFYLSFLRPCICRWFDRKCENISGIPMFGTLFLIAALALLKWSVLVWVVAIALCAIDTGGLFWFCAVMSWYAIARRGN